MGCAPKVNLLGIRRTIKSQRRQRPEIFWPSNRKRQAAHPSQRLFQPESSRPGRPDLPAYRRRARSLRPTLRRHPRIFRTGGAIELDIAPSIAEDRWRLKRAPQTRPPNAPAPSKPASSLSAASANSTLSPRRIGLGPPSFPSAKPSPAPARCGPGRQAARQQALAEAQLLPSVHIPGAKSTIRPAASRPHFCKLGLIFRAPA
jgi:hypothetical protein